MKGDRCRTTSLVWNDDLLSYDFGPGHPLAPIRTELTIRLARDLGIFDRGQVITEFAPASDGDLLRAHSAELIAAVKAASADPHAVDPARGIGTSDDPAFPGMHEASALVAGATLAAAQEVYFERAPHGLNVAGGLHHAMRDRSGGFCIYNDIAVAIAWLLEQGVERIAYLDVDVHHGDGVQEIFWDDPRVLTISIHESPRTLFPGTGWPTETGGPNAPGTAVNIAVPAGTGDQGWLRALYGVVPEVLAAFSPEFIISQHGADSHLEDPLAHLALTIDAQRMAAAAIHGWAHEYAGGKWVAVGGGGYSHVNVVPRTWCHLIAEAQGAPMEPGTEVPECWRAYVRDRLGEVSPLRMTDGADPWPRPLGQGFHHDDPVDAAVLATREAVFPAWGLHPEPDLWF